MMPSQQVQVEKTTGCAMMGVLRGNVRYRFRSDEHDVNVLIEGEADWVEQHVEELGLTGVGWTMPAGTASTSHQPLNRERRAARVRHRYRNGR